jgi:hypothetical protein
MACNFRIEADREEDARWIRDPRVARGAGLRCQQGAAIRSVEALALRALADKLEAGAEKPSDPLAVTIASSIE